MVPRNGTRPTSGGSTTPSICIATTRSPCTTTGVGSQQFLLFKLIGGAFGWGLKRNVIELYKFLCRNYAAGETEDESDRIFLFGFSRGAFTVRVLAGLIDKCGLCTEFESERELHAIARANYTLYREKYRGWQLSRLLPRIADRALVKDRSCLATAIRPKIAFIGVWDTVDAYGLPVDELADLWDRFIFPMRFRDRRLTDRVRKACHAVSIDDERHTFHPVLWDESAEEDPTRIEQVWFPGVHSDVGGGYPRHDLALVSLDWMISRVESGGDEGGDIGLVFLNDLRQEYRRRCDWSGCQHDSRAGLRALYRYRPRDIEALCGNAGAARSGARPPKLHRSAFERIREKVVPYAPTGLPARYDIVTTRETAPVFGERPRRRTRDLRRWGSPGTSSTGGVGSTARSWRRPCCWPPLPFSCNGRRVPPVTVSIVCSIRRAKLPGVCSPDAALGLVRGLVPESGMVRPPCSSLRGPDRAQARGERQDRRKGGGGVVRRQGIAVAAPRVESDANVEAAGGFVGPHRDVAARRVWWWIVFVIVAFGHCRSGGSAAVSHSRQRGLAVRGFKRATAGNGPGRNRLRRSQSLPAHRGRTGRRYHLQVRCDGSNGLDGRRRCGRPGRYRRRDTGRNEGGHTVSPAPLTALVRVDGTRRAIGRRGIRDRLRRLLHGEVGRPALPLCQRRRVRPHARAPVGISVFLVLGAKPWNRHRQRGAGGADFRVRGIGSVRGLRAPVKAFPLVRESGEGSELRRSTNAVYGRGPPGKLSPRGSNRVDVQRIRHSNADLGPDKR